MAHFEFYMHVKISDYKI